MTKHVRIAFWALGVLWGMKKIWPTDRLRLWWKSVHLYLAFQAFTDKDRPQDQLYRAMVCAVLSAVYDYDSDWPHGNRSGKNFGTLLNRYIACAKTRETGWRLYKMDVAGNLSQNALERGSVALLFYRDAIGSNWMRNYSTAEINQFGRKLQIVDDLLDLEKDRIEDAANCFLRTGRPKAFAREAQEFLASDFYTRLKENSKVYRIIEKRVRKTMAQFLSGPVLAKEFFKAGRPTTSAYGLLLALIGFSWYQNVPWWIQLLVACTFGAVTWNIMVFNDYVDRHHDSKKGKCFAATHERKFLRYWRVISTITIVLITAVATQSTACALLCLAVWLLGLWYSYIPHLYLVNNLVVGLCAAAPALTGAAYSGYLVPDAVLTAAVFFFLVTWNEVYKDVEDRNVDLGYKATVPIRLGTMLTFVHLTGWLMIPIAFMAFHPNQWVARVGIICMPILGFQQAIAMWHVEWVKPVKATMRRMLMALLTVLLVT